MSRNNVGGPGSTLRPRRKRPSTRADLISQVSRAKLSEAGTEEGKQAKQPGRIKIWEVPTTGREDEGVQGYQADRAPTDEERVITGRKASEEAAGARK